MEGKEKTEQPAETATPATAEAEKETKTVEASQESKTDPDPAKQPKKPKTGIIIVIAAMIVIALAIFLSWRFGLFGPIGTVVETEILNLTYSVKPENGTEIDSGTDTFSAGTIASALGFKTDTLDSAIASMQEGETKDIELEAADAYGSYDEGLVFSYNRTERIERKRELNRTQAIPLAEFVEAFEEQPVTDKEYTLSGMPWPIKVLESNESHVMLSQEAKVGQELPAGFFVFEVTAVTDEKITMLMQGNDTTIPTPSGNLEITFTDDWVISTLTPEVGQWIELQPKPKARVTGMDDNSIFLDANHELAGKKIIVTITLNSRSIEKSTVTGSATIAGAPTMQVFIMSYCPYGLQMLKGMLPVMEKFQNVANIELRFVGYTMHGQKEEDENYRMICLREEQYAKLIPYLKCFAQSGDSASCIAQAGIDKAKLETCMASKVEQYYAEDKALNEKYGVKGSPTVVIDGQEAQIERSPEAIKTALCEAFTTQPSECSETLSTETPSPGFGSGTSSSGGSCG